MIIEEMTPEKLAQMLAAENVDRARFALSVDDVGPLHEWIAYGRAPGDFLMAVLRNDLREAASRADVHNRRRMFEYVFWLYNEAPGNCWGSPDKVAEWSESFEDHEK